MSAESLESPARELRPGPLFGGGRQKLIFGREVPILGQRRSPRGGVLPRSVVDGNLSA